MSNEQLPSKPAIDKGSYSLEVFKPEWMPFNETAHKLCDDMITRYEFQSSGRIGKRYRLVMASFLYVLARLPVRTPSGKPDKPLYVGISRHAAAWSAYPMVGKDINLRVLDKLVLEGVLVKVEGSGSRQFTRDDETSRISANPVMTMYDVDHSKLDLSDLKEARYVQVGKATLKVNVAEDRLQREYRKGRDLKKPVLSPTVITDVFGDTLKPAQERVQALNDLWSDHPLVLPSGHAAACATRVFHDGRHDAGGRFYGLWTHLPGDYRLQSTIDGEPICQIDISGSQPTLLSALLGIKFNYIPEVETWYDVYTQLTNLWHHGVTSDDVYAALDDANLPDPFKRPRVIAKRVIMEMIGTGNASKEKPSQQLIMDTGITQYEWDHFSERLIGAIPALKKLEPRYDSKGCLTGYINGPGFLSFHESEMVLATIEKLHSLAVPAYPMHDCLIVKETDVVKSVKIFQETVGEYCFDLSGLKVKVPLTIENAQGRMSFKDTNIHPDDLSGKYL